MLWLIEKSRFVYKTLNYRQLSQNKLGKCRLKIKRIIYDKAEVEDSGKAILETNSGKNQIEIYFQKARE